MEMVGRAVHMFLLLVLILSILIHTISEVADRFLVSVVCDKSVCLSVKDKTNGRNRCNDIYSAQGSYRTLINAFLCTWLQRTQCL